MRNVFVLGIGSTSFGMHPDHRIEQLAERAAIDAIADSGIERDRIGALYLGNFVSGVLNGQEILAGLVADNLGLPNIPCTKVEGACASGGIAFRHAYLAIATGQCDVALVIGAEKMSQRSSGEVTAALNCAMDNATDGLAGLTFPGVFDALGWKADLQATAWIAAIRRIGSKASPMAVKKLMNCPTVFSPEMISEPPYSSTPMKPTPAITSTIAVIDAVPTEARISERTKVSVWAAKRPA